MAPKDQMTLDAIDFIQQSKAEPFFYITQLGLICSKDLLEKYCEKLDLIFRAIQMVGKSRRTHSTVRWLKCLIIMLDKSFLILVKQMIHV